MITRKISEITYFEYVEKRVNGNINEAIHPLGRIFSARRIRLLCQSPVAHVCNPR
jgi:hypothetical protein